jgi:hypothetical protein
MNHPVQDRLIVPFAYARNHLQDGDLLQFVGSWWSPISVAIQIVGRSIYSHTGMAAKLPNADGIDEWYCVEVREFKGARTKPLHDYVIENPRRIDVFRPAPTCEIWCPLENEFRPVAFDGKAAVAEMKNICSEGYGYWNVLGTSLLHIPLLRVLARPNLSDNTDDPRPPFCSQAYAEAIARTYVDPVPLLSPRYTEPGDLTRSRLLGNYIFTLDV